MLRKKTCFQIKSASINEICFPRETCSKKNATCSRGESDHPQEFIEEKLCCFCTSTKSYLRADAPMPPTPVEGRWYRGLGICISLWLAKRRKQALTCWKHSAAEQIFCFLRPRKLHFHVGLHTQRPMTSDHMRDFPLVSSHSLLKPPISVSQAGQS